MGGEKGGSWDKPTTPFPVQKGQGGLKERVKNSGGKKRVKRGKAAGGNTRKGKAAASLESGTKEGGAGWRKASERKAREGVRARKKGRGGDEKREESLHHLAFHLTALLRRRLLLLSAPLFSVLQRAIRSGGKFRIESGLSSRIDDHEKMILRRVFSRCRPSNESATRFLMRLLSSTRGFVVK